MNELATHFVLLLGQTTLALAVAVIAVGLILRGFRVTSPTAHRVGWTLALLVGWWFVRFSAQIPWYEPVEEPAPAVVADQPTAAPYSYRTGLWTAAPTEEIAIATPPISYDPPDDAGLIEIGPGGATETYLEPAEPAPHDDLIVELAPHSSDVELPIITSRGSPRADEEPAPAPAPATAATATIQWAYRRLLPVAALAAWASGVFLGITVWILGYVRFVRRLPVARAALPEWTEQWQAIQAHKRVRGQIPLRVTENLGPMLCRLPRGFALLVPEALWQDLDEPQRAAVLRHELAHYQRHDVWKSLAVRLLALPHWFNPLAWLAVRRFDDAAEWACDRAASDGESATKYARTLVRLGESAARHAAYSPAVRGASLRGRVRRLLSAAGDRDSIAKKLLLTAMALVAVAGLAVRVELVAKERAEAPIREPDADSTKDAQDALDGAAASQYIVSTVEVEPLSETDADLIEAAERGFEAARAAYDTDTITLDEVCAWSLRLLSAMEVTARSPDEKVAAAKANLVRFESLRTKIKALFDVGARGGEAEKLALTDYYVADAKRRVVHAERDAEAAKKKLLKARDRAIEQDQKLQESHESAVDVRQGVLRVEAAKKSLAELAKVRDSINFVKDPAGYEAARIKAVEAEHELDQAVRQVVAARRAFAGEKPADASPPSGEADHEKTQPKPDQLSSDERFKQLLSLEAKRREAAAMVRAAIKVQTDADRSGDEQRITEAERTLTEAHTELSAIEAALSPPGDRSSPIDQVNENNNRAAADQASSNLEDALERLDHAKQAKRAADELGDMQKIGDRTEDLAQANQVLAIARREERQARQTLEARLKQRAKSQVERVSEKVPSSIRDRVFGDHIIQQLEVEIAEYDKAMDKYTQTIVDGKGKQSSKTAYQSLKQMQQEKAALEEKFKLRVQDLMKRYADPAETGSKPSNSHAQAPDAIDPAALQKYARLYGTNDPLQLQIQLKQLNDQVTNSLRERESAQTELARAQQQKRGDVDAVDEKIVNDAKVRKLQEDIAKFDHEIAKYAKLMKPGTANHTLENHKKERAGLQEKLDERMKQLEEKYIEPKKLANLREAELKITHAQARIDALDGEIEKQNLRIEGIQSFLKQSGDKPVDRKPNLRYNGRSFAEWRADLETELSPGRLIEACEAFGAFARSGYGAEAAGPIVEVAGAHMSASMSSDTPEGKLVEAATRILIGLPIDAILPSFTQAVASPQLGPRLFAMHVLSQRPHDVLAVLPLLLKGIRDSDSMVRAMAAQTISQADIAKPALSDALFGVLSDHDPKSQMSAMVALAEMYWARPLVAVHDKKFTPVLLEKVKDSDAAVSLAAARALSTIGPNSAPAAATIFPWLKEQDNARRMAALTYVLSLGPAADKAIPDLLAIADGTGPQAELAIRCLGAIGPNAGEATPRLMAIANSRSDIGAAAIRALGRIGPDAKEAIPLLDKFATRSDWPHLKNDAQLALRYIRGERPLTELAPETVLQRATKAEKVTTANLENDSENSKTRTGYKTSN